jgi:L-fuculose-phosphate aldolase
VAITPSGRYYDSLSSNDIVIVDFEGKLVEGKLKPSVETMLHIQIYKKRKKVNAIVHSHPIFSSVAAVAGLEIPAILDDQVTCLGGEIKVAEYASSGSQKMVRNVVSALGSRNAVIMANHGALSVGRDIRDALTNCEMLEKTAKIFIYAFGLGKINFLPKYQE